MKKFVCKEYVRKKETSGGKLRVLLNLFVMVKLLDDILENTSKYVECEKYVSWERFFTDMLIDATRNKREKYLKDTLNEYYLEDAIAKKIIVQMPKDIQEKREIRIS